MRFNADPSLKEIIYEQITPKFGRGKYGNLNVIIMVENGYVNATKLCHLGGKQFRKFMETDRWNDLVNHVAVAGNLATDDLKILIRGGDNHEVEGTYVHPDLIPHVACWVSAQFGVMVSHIVNDHLVREYREAIRVKDTKIDELQTKLDHIIHQNELLLQDNEELMDKMDSANDNLDYAMQKLNDTADVSVPSSGDALLVEQFVLYKRDPNPSYDAYNYGVIRAQRRSISRLLSIQRKRYPNLVVLLRIDAQPNSVNLFHRFKNSYPHAKFAVNSIRLLNVNEADFIDRIREVHEDRNEPVREARDHIEEAKEEGKEEGKEEEGTLRYSRDELEKKKNKELKEICRTNRFKGYSTLTKPQLIEHILTCSVVV